MIRTATIQFPRTLVIKGALELDDLLEGQPPAARFVFDFSALGRTEPFGMLCAAVKMARFISAHPDSEISAVNHSHCSYQSHMGFFRALGFDFGKEPGAAQGSANYLPITSLSVEEIQNEAAETYVHVGDVVTSHAQRISTRSLSQACCARLRPIVRAGPSNNHFSKADAFFISFAVSCACLISISSSLMERSVCSIWTTYRSS